MASREGGGGKEDASNAVRPPDSVSSSSSTSSTAASRRVLVGQAVADTHSSGSEEGGGPPPPPKHSVNTMAKLAFLQSEPNVKSKTQLWRRLATGPEEDDIAQSSNRAHELYAPLLANDDHEGASAVGSRRSCSGESNGSGSNSCSSSSSSAAAAAAAAAVATNDTPAEQQTLPRAHTIRVAALYIKDAVHGRRIEFGTDERSVFIYKLQRSGLYKTCFTVICALDLAIALFEPSAGLLDVGQDCVPEGQEPLGHTDELYTLSNNMQVRTACTCVELFCMAYFLLDIALLYQCAGRTERDRRDRHPFARFYKRNRWACVRLLLVALTLVDIAMNGVLGRRHWFRYSRAFRPFIVISARRNLRVMFAGCVHVFRPAFGVLTLLTFTISLWAFVGYIVFGDVDCADCVYFNSMGESMLTMIRIFTAIQYTLDVMTPYQHESAFAAVFFVSFIVVIVLFLARLLVAVSYKSYKLFSHVMLRKRMRKRRVALQAAFDLLRRNGRVSLLAWAEVMATVRPEWCDGQAELLFASVDREGLGSVTNEQFFELCALADSVQIAMLPAPMGPDARQDSQSHWLNPFRSASRGCCCFFSARCCNCCIGSKQHSRTMFGGDDTDFAAGVLSWNDSGGFLPSRASWRLLVRRVMTYTATIPNTDARVVVSELMGLLVVLLSALQLYYTSRGGSTGWATVGYAVLGYFWVESWFNWTWMGHKRFFRSTMCKIDLCLNVWGVLMIIAYVLINPSHDFSQGDVYNNPTYATLYVLTLAVRVLRLWRVVYLVNALNSLTQSVERVMPVMLRLCFVFFSIIYSFSVFAHEFYGGQLPTAKTLDQTLCAGFPNLNASATLDDATCKPLKAWEPYQTLVNFSTFPSSVLSLFVIAIMTKWTVIMDATVACTTVHSRWFFFGYRIIATLVFLPILVGFVIESFVTQVDKADRRQQQRGRGRQPPTVGMDTVETRSLSSTSSSADGRLTEDPAPASINRSAERGTYAVVDDPSEQGGGANFRIKRRWRANSEALYTMFDTEEVLEQMQAEEMQRHVEDVEHELELKTRALQGVSEELVARNRELGILRTAFHDRFSSSVDSPRGATGTAEAPAGRLRRGQTEPRPRQRTSRSNSHR